MAFASLGIRAKITAALGLIAGLLVVTLAISMAERIALVDEMKQVQGLGVLSSRIGELMHRLQVERGASAVWLGSKGGKFKAELQQFRAMTDEKTLALQHFLNDSGRQLLAKASRDVQEKFASATALLGLLATKRQAIDALTVTAADAADYFSATVRAHVAIIPDIADLTGRGDITALLDAFYDFLELKEYTGEEWAMLCDVLAADKMDGQGRAKYLTIIAKEEVYGEEFLALSDEAVQAFYRGTVVGPNVDESARIRKVVLDNPREDLFGISAIHWFTAISAKLDLLKKVEERLSADLQAASEAHMHEATRGLAVSIGTAVLAVIATAAAFLISRAIVRDIAILGQRARRIGQGDLSSEGVAAITSRDELGELSQAIAAMAGDLRQQVLQSRATTEKLAATAAHILTSTQQQAASTQELATAMQETSTTMEEIRATGAQIAERSRQVASTAEATSVASVAGKQAVQETKQTMETIREQVETVAETIVALSEKAQAIGEIIANVNDIAERANLLALNAGIEAAGAGEHGARFSVVASELKNLADQAKDCTGQVRAMLSDIQKGINTSVMLAEEAVKRAESGSDKAEATNQVIRQFVDTTETSVQAFQQIVAATNQQIIGFDQVTLTLKDMRVGSQQTAAAISQLEQVAKNLAELGRQLKGFEDRFKA